MKKVIKKNLFFIFLIVLVLSFVLTKVLENPIEELRIFLVDKYFIQTSIIYFLLISISTVFSSFTVLPAIPFFSKIFGSSETFVLTFSGVLVGTLISFFIAGKKDNNFISKFFSKKSLIWFEKNMPKKYNFFNILFFRFFTPPDSFSYFLGQRDKIKFSSYFWGTFLGIVPPVFILSFGADAMGSDNNFLFFFLIFAILLIIFSKIWFKFLNKKRRVKIITHAYNFHLDDLFSVATIVLFMEKRGVPYEIIRTSDPNLLEFYKAEAKKEKNKDKIYIVDAGFEYNPDYNLFDHHQKKDLPVRKNGIPYSSFGLVWKKFGEKLCGSKEVADKIDYELVLGIDANDSGLILSKSNYDFFLYGLPSLKNSFYPLDNKKESYDEAFLKVLEIFKNIILNEIRWADKKIKDEKKFESIYNKSENKEVVWLEEELSLGKNFSKYPKLLYLVKKKDDNWVIMAVSDNNKDKRIRRKMPENWCGLKGEELEKETGVKGAIFCHRGGWIAAAKDRGSAEKLIEILMKNKIWKKEF